MSKKRVHEIVKELQGHGIHLDNKAVVTELTSLGYDVKSHSSSLEIDQATAAVQRIVDKLKPRPKASVGPAAPKGFVVRRKVEVPVGVPHGGEGVEHVPAHAAPEADSPAPADAFEAAPQASPPSDESTQGPPASGEPGAPSSSLEASAPQPPPAEAPSAEGAQTSPAASAAPAESPASPQSGGEPPAVSSEQSAAAAPTEPPPAEAPAAVNPPAGAPTSSPSQVRMAPGFTPRAGPARPTYAPFRPGAPTGSPSGLRSSSPSGMQARPGAPAQPPGAQVARPPPGMSSRPPVSGPSGLQSRPAGPPGQRPPGAPVTSGSRPPYQPPGARPGMMQGRPGQGRPGSMTSRPGSVSVRPQLGAPAGAPVDPSKPQMPTATQAVVISRPLIAVKRVTPTQAPGSRYPMAPGKKAIGEVREFRVVPNQFTPGAKDAKERERKGVGGQRRDKDKETSSTSDIRELIFGRISIPVRGKKKKPTKKGQKTLITEMAEEKKVIKVQEGITVSELSQRMGVKSVDIIKKLMAGGKMATANQSIDAETATIIAADFGWVVKKVGFEVEDFLPKVEEAAADQLVRPPVVTVMGHVDHGKTSLLDAIRAAHVADGEAGGITQHIGAYTVKSKAGDITFLDTPGHEAFSAMRARGANITDVVVLVVAADDGVMPQTKEAIQHAQKAEVPIVVAINKMDLPGANVDRVKKDLADNGLLAEDWGGDVIMVPVSAKTKLGIDLLLENLSLQAEVLELKANPNRPAQGTVLEARLEKGRGPVATVLVQEGTLKKGDAVVTGIYSGRVRMLINDRGQTIEDFKPGYSAEVIGLDGVPVAGDVIHAVADEKVAKQIADHRILKQRQAEAGKTSRETLEDLLNKQKAADQKELKLVLKADVSGSLEAVADSVLKLNTRKVKVTIVQKGVGMMTETDMNNAAAFGAAVLGFNSRPESGAETAAKQLEVTWSTYGIIYELLDAVTRMMEDLLEPIRQEKKLGKAEVRQLFNVPKLGVVAGSSVTEGVIKRSAFLRLWRANKQIFQGKIATLKRFKDDVKEVATGFECGIGIEGFSELQPGDVIEAYEIEEIRPSLN